MFVSGMHFSHYTLTMAKIMFHTLCQVRPKYHTNHIKESHNIKMMHALNCSWNWILKGLFCETFIQTLGHPLCTQIWGPLFRVLNWKCSSRLLLPMSISFQNIIFWLPSIKNYWEDRVLVIERLSHTQSMARGFRST